MRFLVLYFIIGLLLPNFSQAQPLVRYRTLGVDDGLPNPNVCGFLQDQSGYVWIITLNGLARYDGSTIQNYRPNFAVNPKARPRDFPYLHESTDGSLWLGYLSQREIWRYDASLDSFIVYARLPEDTVQQLPLGVRALHFDPPDRLWVATSFHGVLRFDSLAKDKLSEPAAWYANSRESGRGLPTDFMAPGIWRDRNGLHFITEAGVATYEPEEDLFKSSTWSEVPENNEVVNFTLDSARQAWWLTTFAGLYRYNYAKQTYRHYGAPDSPGTPFVSNVELTASGRVWISVGSFPNSSIWEVDPASGDFTLISAEREGRKVPLPGVLGMMTDRQGFIWAGNFSRGAQVIDPKPTGPRRVVMPQSIKGGEEFNDREINSITETEAGTFYLGTQRQGVWCWQPQQDRLFPLRFPKLNQLGAEVSTFVSPGDGPNHLWVSTEDGIYDGDLKRNQARRFDPLPVDAENHSRMVYRADGSFWARLKGYGFVQLDSTANSWSGKNFNLNSPEVKRPDGGIFPITATTLVRDDPRGNRLWFATTYDGLLEWRKTEQCFNQHLPGYSVSDLLATPDGMLWVASTAGLLLYDPEKQQRLDHEYPDLGKVNFPTRLLRGKGDLLWVLTRRGLSTINWHKRTIVNQLTAEEWLPAGQSWGDGWQNLNLTADRKILVANGNGLFTVDPLEALKDTFAPAVKLRELWVAGKKVPLPFGKESSLSLGYRENQLGFLLAAPYFPKAESVNISYQLDGFDDLERQAAAGSMIDYPRLPPGNYVLRARSCNPDDFCSQPLPIVRLRIRPPWYASGWAYFLYLASGLSLLYLWYRQQVLKRERAAEQRYLKELDVAKTALFTNISHEFRTPLTLILGESSLMLPRLNHLLRPHAERIQRNGGRLLWLVEQLLELGRADSGFLQIEPKRGDVMPFLRYNLSAFSSLADPKEINLHFRGEPESLEMDFDPERLQRILSNLLANAVKFTPTGGNISLRATTVVVGPKRYLSVFVVDDGPGIAPEEMPLIFDRFHRATRHEAGGAGIGLALARELAQAMGGELTVKNGLKGGAAFNLSIPITRKAEPLDQMWSPPIALTVPNGLASTEPAVVRTNLRSGSRLSHLLVVEDDEDLRAFIFSTLRNDYELTLARDGVEGLELTGDQAFDLIISDVMMPRMDGYELCATLKEDFVSSHIPVILLTAKADRDSRLEGYRRGADAYLSKPFDPQELLTRCQQLLEQKERLRQYYLELLSMPSRNSTTADQPPNDELSFLQRARKAVEKQIEDENFGPEELARSLSISRSQLHRKLIELTDLSATHFLRRIRLTKAEFLLLNSEANVSEIAYRCGFRDPNYFSRVFRESYGESPTELRRIHEESE